MRLSSGDHAGRASARTRHRKWLRSGLAAVLSMATLAALAAPASATDTMPWGGQYADGSVKPTLTYERGALIREEVQTFSLWPLLLNGYRYSKARGVHVQHQCSGCGS